MELTKIIGFFCLLMFSHIGGEASPEPPPGELNLSLPTAEACYSEGKYKEAVPYYLKALEIDQHPDNLWLAEYHLGNCYYHIDDTSSAIVYFKRAISRFNERIEPYYQLANLHRCRGEHALCSSFAKQVRRLPYITEDYVGRDKNVDEYLVDRELSICSYYIHEIDEGLQATDRLLLNKKTPYHIKEEAKSNLFFYLKAHPHERVVPINVETPTVSKDSFLRYQQTNPAVIKTAKGYQVILRLVDYIQVKARHFQLFNGTKIKSQNYFITMDHEFNIQDIELLKLPNTHEQSLLVDSSCTGLEDCRFIPTGELNAIFAGQYHEEIGGTQIYLVQLPEQKNEREMITLNPLKLESPIPKRVEKNWMPLVHQDKLLAIYGYDPLTILVVNKETGKTETYKSMESPVDLRGYSGSSPPIAFEGGYLGMIHLKVFLEVEGIVYIRRWIWYDQELNIKKLSVPFYFLQKGVEFVPGVDFTHDNQHLVIGLGVFDNHAFLLTTKVDDVKKMLVEVQP